MGFEDLPPREKNVDWYEERSCQKCRRLEAENADLKTQLEKCIEENKQGIKEYAALEGKLARLVAENKRLTDELQLVTSPHDSVGAVINYYRERLRALVKVVESVSDSLFPGPLYAKLKQAIDAAKEEE